MSNNRKIGPYFIGRTLGEGGFSKVKLGVHETTGEQVALKILKKGSMDESAKAQVQGEINAMANVIHPNVIRLISVDYEANYPQSNGKTNKVILVVLEMAKGGELFEFLSFTGQFEEAIARTYFHQLINGVGYCHDRNVVHRDLKPENLLFNEQFDLKIADFGFSKVVDNNMMFTQCGTPGYMAPEMFTHQGYDAKKADIWACGVILFIMIAGFPPFQKPNVSDWWFHKLQNNRHELFWRAHSRTVYFSDAMKDLLNKILCPDASRRISLENIMKHPWFTAPIVPQAALQSQLQARKNKVDAQKLRENMTKLAMEHGQAETQGMGGVMADVRSLGSAEEEGLPPTMEFFSHGIVPASAAPSAGFGGDMGMSSLSMEEEKSGSALAYEESMACYTQFESTESASVLFEQVSGWVETLTKEFTSKDKLFKVKASVMSHDSGTIKLSAQVFETKDGKRVVHLARLNGDGMAFRAMFNQLRESMQDFIAA